MPKKQLESVAQEEVDEAEAKRQRKAAKKAAKEAPAAAAAEEAEVDEAEAKRQRKASKKAAKEAAAAAAAEEEEVDEVEAKRQRKAAKKAANEAAAAAEEEEVEEAKRQRKAAKRAAKEAAAAAAVEEAYAEEVPKKSKKEKRLENSEDAEKAPKAKKNKEVTEQAAEAATTGQDEKSLKVFIKGLPYSVDEATLRNDFTECGEITKLQLPMEDGRPKGFAFITFATPEGFDAALKYDNTDYGGRYINVSEANADGKGKDGKGKDGKGKAAKGSGKGKPGDWTCPKCGDLQFARNSACRQCGAENPAGLVARDHDHENTVFLKGLPWAADDAMLRKDFADCGEIESVRIPMNGEGKPMGIAFIKFVTPDGVTAALKFDATEYGGRILNVCKSGEFQSSKGEGKSKGKDSKGKDGKGKGKSKSKAPSESKAKSTGCIVASAAAVKTFEDSDDE